MSSGLNSYAAGFQLGLNTICTGCVGGGLGANGTAANAVFFSTTATFNDGNWHQAVMIVDQTAKTAQIYVDGVAQTLSGQDGGTVSGSDRQLLGLFLSQHLQHHGTIQREDYLRARLEVRGDEVLTATTVDHQDSSLLGNLAVARALVIRPPFAPAAVAGSPASFLRLPR